MLGKCLLKLSVSLALFAFVSGTTKHWPHGDGSDMLIGSCEFAKHTFMNHKTREALRKLRPLIGKRFSTDEPEMLPGRKPYKYDVGICTEGSNKILDNTQPRVDKDTVSYDVAAVLQWNTKRPDQPPNVLGAFNQTEIMSGSNWISLTYEGGDKHRHKCSDEGRRSVIMIVCSPDERRGKLVLVEENYNKTEDCFYLFELSHRAACLSSPPYSLSVGSIICIVFFGLWLLYLGVGCLIQRFWYKARGAEQIPNLSFWQNCGHLQADGCSLVCRCGGHKERGLYQDVATEKQVVGVDIKPKDDMSNGTTEN